MKKNNRGITIISLIVTIIILLILTAIIVTDIDTGGDYKRYTNMCSDIKLIHNKVLIYYNKYGDIPTTELTEEEKQSISAIIGTTEIAKVDFDRLSGFSLNFGDEGDIFVIDTTTFKVYYLYYDGESYSGIYYKDAIYYTD